MLEKATRALEDHCDDLDDMINIVVAGYIVDWANALKVEAVARFVVEAGADFFSSESTRVDLWTIQ